jgi:hypothetical protein
MAFSLKSNPKNSNLETHFTTVRNLKTDDDSPQKIDGDYLWATGDPVHAVPALYAGLGFSILATVDEMGRGEVAEAQA